MTPTEAIAYLTPHEHTADTASLASQASEKRTQFSDMSRGAHG